MSNKKIEKIPSKVVPRLSRYYRILRECGQKEWVSSQEISDLTGFTAAQIRRDLAYFGQFGSPGRGYGIEELKKSIKGILGLDRIWNVCIIGLGNLGMAFLGYKGFQEQGFRIVAAFDSDTRKIGKKIHGIEVFAPGDMQKAVKEHNIRIAMLTVPGNVAQSVAVEAMHAGIKSILNFAPVHLKLPDSVIVRHIDMTVEIERLSFLISRE